MKETIFNVKGMVCGGCENRLKNALTNIEGVQEVVANHTTGIVKITLNKDISENIIVEKIEDLGFEVLN